MSLFHTIRKWKLSGTNTFNFPSTSKFTFKKTNSIYSFVRVNHAFSSSNWFSINYQWPTQLFLGESSILASSSFSLALILPFIIIYFSSDYSTQNVLRRKNLLLPHVVKSNDFWEVLILLDPSPDFLKLTPHLSNFLIFDLLHPCFHIFPKSLIMPHLL